MGPSGFIGTSGFSELAGSTDPKGSIGQNFRLDPVVPLDRAVSSIPVVSTSP